MGLLACSSSSSSGGDGSGTDGGGSSNPGTDGGSGGSKDSGSSTGDSGSGSGGAAACLQNDGAVCATYDPPSPSGCASDSTSVASCPTAGLQAQCAFRSGNTDEVFYWYTSGGVSNTGLKSVCDSESGTFTAD